MEKVHQRILKLKNKSYIESLNLEIGCEVKVIRSGDIIPRITGRVEK